MPITVNGVAVTDAEIDREVQHHPAPTLEAARAAATQALVVRQLLLQEARRQDLDAGVPDGAASEESAIGALVERAVSVPEADEATCRRFFDNNPARFRSPDLFEAAHILFPAAPDDATARQSAKAAAQDVIRILTDHPDRFAELARERSACPSKAQGGSLGQITRGQTVPEFETFLVHLEPGTLCPVPVPTPYGYHVLRLDRRVEGRPLPFEAVQGQIAQRLQETSWRRAVRQYIQILAGGATIRGIALDAATSPLVQ